MKRYRKMDISRSHFETAETDEITMEVITDTFVKKIRELFNLDKTCEWVHVKITTERYNGDL